MFALFTVIWRYTLIYKFILLRTCYCVVLSTQEVKYGMYVPLVPYFKCL